MQTSLGLLLVSVMIVGSACATMPATPPSVNVSGSWAGTWSFENSAMGAGSLRGTFQQDGANLSGRFDILGPAQTHVANLIGFVSGNEVRLSQPASGTLTVSGNEMSGWVNGLMAAKLTLRKQ